jgi:2-amino-4-hydroxy-6-hydroxymethyldihydropteridine diphosphokinase
MEGVGGGEFYNCAMTGEWTADPGELVRLCRRIESDEGSAVSKHRGARSLDVDILFFDGLTSLDGGITLPHPRMHLRGFVLVPLREVWPDTLPGLGATAESLLAECPADGHIIRVTEIPAPGAYWSGTDAR